MPLYIDRDSLITTIEEKVNPQGYAHLMPENVYAAMYATIHCVPIADVVEVVRCQNCKFSREVDKREPKYKCVNICREGCTQWLDSTDYCSYGVRKGVDEE